MSKIINKPECTQDGCQVRMLHGVFLSAIRYGKGAEGCLKLLCSDCRQGKGIVIALLAAEKGHDLTAAEFQIFAERTGFHPEVISTAKGLADWEEKQRNQQSVPSQVTA